MLELSSKFHRVWTPLCLSYTRRGRHLCHQQSYMFVMLRSLDIAVRRGGHIAVTSMQELRHLDMCMFACRTVFTGGCWWTPPALHPTGVLREARIRYSKGALMLRRLDGRVLEACTSRRRLTDDSRGARDVNLRISNTRQIHVSLNKRITACTDGTALDILLCSWRGEISIAVIIHLSERFDAFVLALTQLDVCLLCNLYFFLLTRSRPVFSP